MSTNRIGGSGEIGGQRDVTIPPGLLDELLRPIAKQVVKHLLAKQGDELPAFDTKEEAAGGVTND